MLDEFSDQTGNFRSTAIEKVDSFIAGFTGAGRLPTQDLERYCNDGYSMGWRISVDFSDGVRRDLHMLADGDFPYTSLRIALANPPDVLTWPHLETGGFLCTLPPEATVSSYNPAGVAKYVLGQACRLIEESIHGCNIDDFRREFLSYWELAVDNSSQSYISLLEPLGPGRRICVWRSQQIRIVGETPETLRRWLERWGIKKVKGQSHKLYDGVLIWLPKPLVPQDYPKTAADVRTLAREYSLEATNVLEKIAASGASEIDTVLGAPTPNGTCFAAVIVQSPRVSRKVNNLQKGFRPGCVPQNLLVNRYLAGGTKVTKATVERADHLWIHGRDQDPRQENLRHARVAILGCGSVGAPLARLLAQAGIGNLLLVDPDIMCWPNVGRHELGAGSVNRFKVPELAREIEEAYPHLSEVTWRRERVGLGARDLMRDLKSYDLIVSTMGNWPAESFLNDIQQSYKDFPQILYGWVEPNAAAAHALLIPHIDTCLRCGMDDKGHPHLQVTSWPNGGETLHAPACGAEFTPYGPAELCWAHALLSETAIEALISQASESSHRIWIGDYSRVEAAGGIWATDWITEMGDPGNGGMKVKRRWPISQSCPVCLSCAHAS